MVLNLKDLGITPSSMIDISDGLASELHHLCTQSKVGCTIYEDKLPIDPTTYNIARDFELDPTMCVLNGGEDYELLFTISQDDYDKVKGHMDFSVIGHITAESAGLQLVAKNDTVHPLKAQGWDHLKQGSTDE